MRGEDDSKRVRGDRGLEVDILLMKASVSS